MPTYLSTAQKTAFIDTAKELTNRLVRPQVRFNIDDFLLAYWTPEQYAAAKATSAFCDFGSAGWRDVRVRPREDLAPGFKVIADDSSLAVEYRNWSDVAMFPRASCPRIDNEYTGRMVQYEQWLVRRAFEIGCFKLVIEHLVNKCSSLEAMRYLFPGTLWLLNRMGEHELASKVDSVKKAPTLPLLRPDQRWRLRFINQWWAVRMLMDDMNGIEPPFDSNGQTCCLSFDIGLLCTKGNLEPDKGEEPGQEWLFLKSWS